MVSRHRRNVFICLQLSLLVKLFKRLTLTHIVLNCSKMSPHPIEVTSVLFLLLQTYCNDSLALKNVTKTARTGGPDAYVGEFSTPWLYITLYTTQQHYFYLLFPLLYGLDDDVSNAVTESKEKAAKSKTLATATIRLQTCRTTRLYNTHNFILSTNNAVNFACAAVGVQEGMKLPQLSLKPV